MANIELDGVNKKIKVDSGDLTLDVPGDIVLDADGGDVVFADGGTNLLKVTNSSSDVVLQPQVDTKDIVFKQYDGTTVATVEDNGTFNVAANKLAINGTAITSTAAELNILDGVTATASELNLLDGGTSVGSSITLADADGFVVNDGGTMKTIPATDVATYAGGGKILQHVTSSSTTGTDTTATGFTATSGLPTLNITPSASSSKILLFASFGMISVNNANGYITIFRDSTDLGGNNYGFTGTNSGTPTPAGGAVYTDSPNTTSQVTYSVRVRGDTGTTVTLKNVQQTLNALELGA